MMNHTQKLNKDTTFLLLARGAFGTRQDVGMSGFLRLPQTSSAGEREGPAWQILLELTGQNRGLLPFEITGDVVLGRGSEGPDAADLDLTALNALSLGVSRRHALLRPTAKHLYLIDLDSTNGTFLNGLQIKGRAQPLLKGDHISLGKLNMSVVSLDYVQPEEHAPAKENAQKAASSPGSPLENW